MNDARQQARTLSPRHSGLSPDLDPVTLVFADASLEAAYRAATSRRMLPLVRFGVLLAIGLFLLFGVFDWWLAYESRHVTWTIRGAVLLVGTALLAWTFRPGFLAHRETAMVGLVLMLALALAAIIAVIPADIANEYFAGFLLLIMAAYSILGLRFLNATWVAVLVLLLYLAVEAFLHQQVMPHVVSNTTFIVSAGVIGGLGGYAAELQRRLAFFRRRVIELQGETSAHDALHDALTGLANRRLFMERLAQAVARDERFDSLCAVLFIDLDAFKEINDRRGHAFGDRLLRCVAERLLTCVRDTDTVARFGGDEFVVLLEDLARPECLDVLIERIESAFSVDCDVDGVRQRVTPSIGRALHPGDGRGPRELLEAADRSMYRQKTAHGRRENRPTGRRTRRPRDEG